MGGVVEEESPGSPADARLGALIRDNQAAIVGAVSERMQDEPAMSRMAEQRMLSARDLASQVAAFWVKALASDVTMGSEAALRENLSWSVRFARGHGLAFTSDMYCRYFDWVCEEVASRSADPAQRGAVERYRVRGRALIHELVDPQFGLRGDGDVDGAVGRGL
jgi:hypothetical protein